MSPLIYHGTPLTPRPVSENGQVETTPPKPPPAALRLDHILGLDSVRHLTYSPEILAAAEEIVDGSDVLGLESSQIDCLLRVILFLDRSSGDRKSLKRDERIEGEG